MCEEVKWESVKIPAVSRSYTWIQNSTRWCWCWSLNLHPGIYTSYPRSVVNILPYGQRMIRLNRSVSLMNHHFNIKSKLKVKRAQRSNKCCLCKYECSHPHQNCHPKDYGESIGLVLLPKREGLEISVWVSICWCSPSCAWPQGSSSKDLPNKMAGEG